MTPSAQVFVCLLAAIILAGSGQACSRKSSEQAQRTALEGPKESAPRRERQPGAIKNFAANPTDGEGQRLVVRGESAIKLAEQSYSITNLFIQTERGGVPDMVIQAPHCIYDGGNGTFSSAHELFVRTVDERLALRGRGFLFLQRESRLSISNDVQTSVRKRALSEGETLVKPATAASALSADTSSSAAGTDPDLIRILSNQLDYRANLALFQGKVRATESDGALSCGRLAVHFGAGGSNRVERLEAEDNVTLDQGNSRATGDKATYVVERDKGVVQLSGHATWRDDQREGSADTLILDRVRNVVRAEGHARMKLPRQILNQPGSLFAPSENSTARSAGPRDFLEFSSHLLRMQLSPTNGAVQRIDAETNVVIVSPAENSRATGQKLVYDQSLGTVELQRDAVWQGLDRLVKGETLVFDTTNRVFSARRNAYMRVPVAALGKSSLLARDQTLPPSAVTATNLFIEAFADEFDYRTNRMDFRRNVRAHLLAGEFKQAELICPALRIDIGERLEGILADGGVTARQFPSPNRNDRQVVREIRSEKLHAMMNAEGRLETLLAEQNVQGEQTVPGTGKAKPTITKFVADRLTAKFAAATNQVQTMVAERNVTIEQDGRTAHGSHAHYDGASQVLELTGQPTAVAPEGRITEAEVLVWDAAKEQLRVKGKFKSEWQRLRTARMDEALKR